MFAGIVGDNIIQLGSVLLCHDGWGAVRCCTGRSLISGVGGICVTDGWRMVS